MATRFVNEHGSAIFGDIPFVVAAANAETAGLRDVRHAVISHASWIEETTALALGQNPGARRIVLVGDGGLISRNFIAIITGRVAALRPDLPVEVMDTLAVDDLADRVARLPRGSVVLYTVVLKDTSGTPVVSRDVAARLAAVSPVPFYGFHEQLLGTGIVGGYLLSGKKVALAAVAKTLQLLGHGVSPSMNQGLHSLVFDRRALDRWSIPVSSLPPEAEIAFDDTSFLARYRVQIAVVLSFVLVETLLLLYLFRLYHQRMRLAAELTRSNAVLEQRVKERTADLDRANRELKRQNEILLENQKLREEMEHISRHDIRSPLSGIIGFCDEMESIPSLPEDLPPIARMIKDRCYQIIDTANRSLDLRKIEMGSYELCIENTDLLVLLRQIGHDTASQRETDAPLRLTLGQRPRGQGGHLHGPRRPEPVLFHALQPRAQRPGGHPTGLRRQGGHRGPGGDARRGRHPDPQLAGGAPSHPPKVPRKIRHPRQARRHGGSGATRHGLRSRRTAGAFRGRPRRRTAR